MKLITGFQLAFLSIIHGYETSAAPSPSNSWDISVNVHNRSIAIDAGDGSSGSWDISVDGGITVAPVEESRDIILTVASYNISDRATEIRFMTPDCKIPLKHSLVGEPYIVNETRTDGFRQFDVQARLNGTEIFFDGIDRDEIYDGNAIEGVVSFCVSNTNYMTEERAIAVNNLNVAANIHIDMKTSSLILPDIDLERTVVDTETILMDFNHLTKAYLCKPSAPLIDISNATEPIVYSQGLLSICIVDKLEGNNRVSELELLTVSQRRNDDTEIRFDYIRKDTNGDGGFDAQLVGINIIAEHNIVVVTMQLIADFFYEHSPAPLSVVGEVSFNYGGGRRLSMQNPPLNLPKSFPLNIPVSHHMVRHRTEDEQLGIFVAL